MLCRGSFIIGKSNHLKRLNHVLPQFRIFILHGFSETIDAGNRGFRSIAAAGRRYAALVAGG